jgi:transketolase
VTSDVDELAIAPMRMLSVDAVQKAESTHPFGTSAPLQDLEGKFALTIDAVADAARGVLAGGAAA